MKSENRKRKRSRKPLWEEEDERLEAEEDDKFIVEEILDKRYDQEK
jgi:hypothetical protein